jgi:O-antigen/teichoic acid export membrane protein
MVERDTPSVDLKGVARSGLWFGGFKLAIQAFSWIITIVVARILVPEDYGLMALATIVIGYVEFFSELGLGSAIVQRTTVTRLELSSNFWFSVALGAGISVVGFVLAYATAWIFDEPRVVPITQLMATLFLLGGMMIVPFNLLVRECRFKEIGALQLIAALISSGSTLLMALAGYGVWALVWGTVILRSVTVCLVFHATKWSPDFHFSFREVRSYLRFGLNIAGTNFLYYSLRTVDKWIVGRMLGVESLGYYTLAMELAAIPSDKVVTIIKQVAFPVFSRLEGHTAEPGNLYLVLAKYISLMIWPVLLGGAFFGEEIILFVLGEKWALLIFPFKMFCLLHLVVALTAMNVVINNAQDRPLWGVYLNLWHLLLMPPAIFVAARYGLEAVAISWIVVSPMLNLLFTWATLKKIKIHFQEFVATVLPSAAASVFMIVAIFIVQHLLRVSSWLNLNLRWIFFQELFTGVIIYSIYLYVFEKRHLQVIWNLKSRNAST